MSDFARIKERVDLLEFILREAGGEVRRDYGHYVHLAECPFCGGHECFSVHRKERFYKCFQCDAGGDLVTFAQRHFLLDSPLEALRLLSEKTSIALEEQIGEKAGPSEGGEPAAQEKSPRARVFAVAAAYYAEILFSGRGTGPLEHLTQKRKHTVEALKEFGVGFSDGALHRALAKDFSREELLESGLVMLRGETLFDAFPPGLFVYPHRMPNGEIGDFTCKPFGEGRTPLRLKTEFREKGCLFLNQPVIREREIVLVEGQNDLLSAFGKGKYGAVLATCGQLSEDQLKLLLEVSKGKTLFLAFDHDEAGRKYTRKVRESLRPLPLKLLEILGEHGTDVRVLTWPGEAKDVDEYLCGQKDPKTAFETLLSQALPLYEPLTKCFSYYREHCSERKQNFFSPDAAKNQATILWQWLGAERSFFVEKTGHGRCYLSRDGKVYGLGAEPNFRALLYDVADLVYSEPRAKVIFDALECLCLLHGRRIEVSPWLHVEGQTLYLHTARPDDLLLQIQPGSVTCVPNAQHCLLRPSNKMTPLEFDAGISPEGAFRDFRELFLQNLSTDPASRYFVACWLLNVFLLPFSRDRALLHMSGTAASGKTTAANLCSVLLYGEDWVGKSRTASDFADGMTNPLTIKDNLESRDIDRGTLNFLLAAATGTVNQKRKGGTDSENVYERLYNQVIVTAIEPFDVHELVTRTWNVEFESKHGSPGFQKTIVLDRLREERSKILSAFFLVLSREILPVFPERKRFYLGFLRQMFPHHAKQRLDEFLAGLFVILEAVLKYVPDERRPKLHGNPEKQAREIIEELLAAQEAKARETETHTNPVLFYLEQLVSELLHAKSSEDFSQVFQIRHEAERFAGGRPSRVSFRDNSLKFHAAFAALAKKRGLLNPFSTAQQMGARLKDSLEILERSGWQVQRYSSQGRTVFYCVRDIGEDE